MKKKVAQWEKTGNGILKRFECLCDHKLRKLDYYFACKQYIILDYHHFRFEIWPQNGAFQVETSFGIRSGGYENSFKTWTVLGKKKVDDILPLLDMIADAQPLLDMMAMTQPLAVPNA